MAGVIVAAQPATPPPVGLITSARTTLDDEAGGQWARGLTYRPESCGGYRAMSGCDVQDVDHTEPLVPVADYMPWVFQVEETCSTLGGRDGYDRAEVLERLRRQVVAWESYAIGRELMLGEVTRADFTAGQVDHPNPYLADTDLVTDVTPVSGTAVKPTFGLGLLQEAAGDALKGQVAYLHAPLVSAERIALHVRADGALRRTLRDNQVVIEAGYPNVAPGGAAASAGTAWLYATGLVVVRRGPILDGVRTQAEALDRDTNRWVERVSRPVAAHFDPCAQFAVQITLED